MKAKAIQKWETFSRTLTSKMSESRSGWWWEETGDPLGMRTTKAVTTKQGRQLRIFLCHSSGDKQVVRDLYGRLRADGFAPWLDEEELLPGQDWRQAIPKAVRDCDVVIVCLSEAFNQAGYRQKEVRLALDVADEQPEDAIFLIPVKLEACEVPDSLRRWQWANLFQAGGYDRLVLALKARSTTSGIAIRATPDDNNTKSIEEYESENAVGTPPNVPANLQSLLDELRKAVTGPSFPKAEWYWTGTPDFRAKVVINNDFRVFARIRCARNWFNVQLKEGEEFRISNSPDLEKHREAFHVAYIKAEQYLQRGK